MLGMGGAEVRLAGFKRMDFAPADGQNICCELGVTADAKLASRAMSVAGVLVRLERLRGAIENADIILARNLEMLAIAVEARKRFAPGATLVYECLDIHRLLLSGRLAGMLLRKIETYLWRHVDLLLTSSPAFIENYFGPRKFAAKIELAENKLLEGEFPINVAPRPATGPPWKIGYFGILRCAQSMQLLKRLAEKSAGAVEIIIRGKPSPAIFPDFAAELADTPYIRFCGPYSRQRDLGQIYGEVHFVWAIDFYEESQNSSWLLPNRLYESCCFGAVPIVLSEVETGRWLSNWKAGVRLTEPLEDKLGCLFQGLDAEAYEKLVTQVMGIPKEALTCDEEDCQRLLSLMAQREKQMFERRANNTNKCR